MPSREPAAGSGSVPVLSNRARRDGIEVDLIVRALDRALAVTDAALSRRHAS